MWKYAKTEKLKESDTDLGWRHIPFAGPAASLALSGADKDQQVQGNWDFWKLVGGGLAGAALGGTAAAAASHYSGASDIAPTAGLLGALGGGLLGNYLTFKTISKNRKQDNDFFAPRHLIPVVGLRSQTAALQGMDRDSQVDTNINALKLAGIGLLGSPLGAPGSAAAQILGYKLMKDHRLRKQK